MRRTRRGFTIIEILVVISIIAILAALLLPALNMLRNKQRQVATQKLLQSVGVALDQYISTYAILGADGTANSQAFCATPLKYLVVDPVEPYLELKLIQMGTGSPATQVAKRSEAEVLFDAWFQPITFLVENGQTGGRGPYTYTDKVQLISRGASEGKTDDVTYGMEIAEGRWKQEEVIEYDSTDYIQ